MKPIFFPAFFRGISAVARETYLETGSKGLMIILPLASLLLLMAGMSIPSPMGREGSMGPVFFHGGITLVLSMTGMAYGAWILRTDKSSGFHEIMLSKPISGSEYFLGRFVGLAFRLTVVTFTSFFLCGAAIVMFSPGTSFFTVSKGDTLAAGKIEIPMDRIILLQPGGNGIHWSFNSDKQYKTSQGELRFRFRPRYPRDAAYQLTMPLSIEVKRGSDTIVDREVIIKNRKSLDIQIPLKGEGKLDVSISVLGSRNCLEIAGTGCSLVHGFNNPILAMMKCSLSFLPIIYLCLAVALMFSTFVTAPTAFFATATLALLTLAAPSLKSELMWPYYSFFNNPTISAEDSLEEEGAWRLLGKKATELGIAILDRFPDTKAGGGIDPLTRMECPTWQDVRLPWKEGYIHLIVMLLAGSLLSLRRAQ